MSQFKTPPENDKANAKEKKGDVDRGKRGGYARINVGVLGLGQH